MSRVALTMACRLGLAIVVGATILPALGPRTAHAGDALTWTGERDDAVTLARQGDTTAALAILRRLQPMHPGDVGLARDLVAITAWSGDDRETVELFEKLLTGPQPDYVIAAVAGAYLHLGQSAEALVLYRQGLARTPGDPRFASGEIRAMTDLGRIVPALAQAESNLATRGDRIEILLAAGYAARAQKKPVLALGYLDRATTLDPANRQVTHDRIMAIDEMGAPQVARQLSDENPGVLSADEVRQIDGDTAAALVRWGVLEPPSEELRFAASDRAIAALDVLIARWTAADADAGRDLLRARFDRMVAYRDRVRMSEVVAEYEDLVRRDVAIPGYALVAAADAYLYLRQPEVARDLYLRGLAVDPNNPDTRLALFYAYVDLDDFEAAYREADSTAGQEPVWIYLDGLTVPVENPDQATSELTAAEARLYAGELADAHRRIAALANAAPNNTRYLSALANVYGARGWPRLAAEEYQISRALKPRNVTTEVGQALNELELREYPIVETAAADLMARFPESREAQRLDRLWQVHQMAEFSLDVEATPGGASSVNGGNGIAVEAQLYSPPIAYNWRGFGGTYLAHEQLPEGEGNVTLRQSALGIAYSGPDLEASVAGTLSAYGPDTGETLRSDIDEGRGGLRAEATWSLDDYLQIGADAEIFSRDTPLRAIGNGITANALSLQGTYRQSELRAIRVGGQVMDFSDGNQRSILDTAYTQRLVTRPHVTLDGILGLAGSANSADSNRPYYNPGRDALATAAASIQQDLYRRYELIWDHHLVLTPGLYWQQGFGTAPVASVLYEQRLRIDDVFDAGVGLNLGRQSYDGEYENAIAVLFSLTQRF